MILPPQVEELDPHDDNGSSSVQISFHALSGQLTPETLRVTGSVMGHEVAVLIDGGSTHNSIQDKVFWFLNLKAQPTKQLHVKVGNGNELSCSQVCRGVQVLIQNHIFQLDLYVMVIAGADLVFIASRVTQRFGN